MVGVARDNTLRGEQRVEGSRERGSRQVRQGEGPLSDKKNKEKRKGKRFFG